MSDTPSAPRSTRKKDASRAFLSTPQSSSPRVASQQPDDGLAMHLGHRDHLVQEPALLESTRESAIALSLPGRVLPYTRSRHGALLGGDLGNRDF